MMPNICIEKLDSDSDSENEEVKELGDTGMIKKSNTLGPDPISMKDLPSWSASSLESKNSSCKSQNFDDEGAVSETSPTGKRYIKPLRNLSDTKFSILSLSCNLLYKDPDKKKYTIEEVAKHDKRDDCWTIFDGKVFDVTRYLSSHPGGKCKTNCCWLQEKTALRYLKNITIGWILCKLLVPSRLGRLMNNTGN
ncbi:unnamed protein product [Moneuplotes crassus]|uniref:Cytochrome b5 heme-binding domain-containing protein n=1 Tax=Euplotes crassus TaxID=5936 RepID=A0AAD2D193_EUPCR|nr:unnamed protein product [Moneuplotes crassus]